MGQAPKRNWINVPYLKSNRTERKLFDFTVVSYNILADNLLWKNLYLYKSCPPEALQWDYRRDKIIAELHQANADVSLKKVLQTRLIPVYLKPSCYCKQRVLQLKR